MRWYILLFFFLFFLYSASSQGEEVCMQQGGECKSICGSGETQLDLNVGCSNGLMCCISDIQALNNPSTSSRCSDGTPYSSCSDFFSGGLGKPNYCDNGNLVSLCEQCGCPGGSLCSNGVCLSTGDGSESYDLSLVNSQPIVSQIPVLSTPFDPIDLNLFAEDPEGNILIFNFADGTNEYNSDILSCSINGVIFSCLAKGTGPDAVAIIASDGEKTNEIIITVDAIKQEAFTGKNSRPVANAGKDVTVFSGQEVVLDAGLSYDEDGNLPSLNEAYVWKERGVIIGKGKILKTKFPTVGTHVIILEVTDLAGAITEDSVTVRVREKNNCVNSKAVYFPQDTVCTKEWPSGEGERIAINTESDSCDLFEVCDDGLDYIVEEAINCCDGTPFLDSRRSASCSYANRNSGGDVKTCQALYLIKGFGDGAVYMQDYLYSEMCCYGVRELCPAGYPLYTPRPLPLTDTNPNTIQCKTTKENRVLGEWLSDTRLDLNNIALQDVHAGATVNVLATGTCVDYSAAVVTTLRKLGFRSSDIFLAEATNHAYTLVKFPLDRKYTIIDTTGNADPITIGGLPPQNYPYCENILNCYNDNGRAICPELKDIKGCIGVKESVIKQGSRIGFKAKMVGENIIDKLVKEAKR